MKVMKILDMQVRDAGNLLTRAGLNIPSVDIDELTAHYGGLDELVDHLRHASTPETFPNVGVQIYSYLSLVPRRFRDMMSGTGSWVRAMP